tara:strand:+ start:731 stop:1810 length:1080 start_codon:yes stop_codon:yes gene_type:complete
MQVILHNSQFFHQRYGGVTRYSVNLIEKMINNKLNFQICAPIYKNKYIKKIEKKYIFGFHFSKYPNIFILRYLNKILVNYYLKGKDKELIHFMYDPEHSQKNISQKKIITIHDTIHERYERSYNNNFYSRRKEILKQMDKIICVSNNTKKDLIEYYDIENSKISVIYNGADHLNTLLLKDGEDIKNSKPYILYVGSRGKYKNFRLFIESYKKSKKIFNNFNVICFGGGSFSKDEIDFFKRLNVLKNVSLVLGDDLILKSYYKNASLFIYPSLYEGFGISILEAMNLGCPTLVSNIPVFREILENKTSFFDPKSHEDLIFSMEKILFDNENKINLISIGNKIAKKYTWSKCYDETINLYS